MVKWKLVYTKQAQNDAKKLISANLKDKAIEILNILENDPYQSPTYYEKLVGDLSGAYSRRINIQHRIVYQLYDEQKIFKIIRMWTHYE
jgi:Txe/YoeB family toxin of toxin-antitoxin system